MNEGDRLKAWARRMAKDPDVLAVMQEAEQQGVALTLDDLRSRIIARWEAGGGTVDSSMSPEAVVRAVAASAVYMDIDGGWSMPECAETGDAVLDALRQLGPEVVMAGLFGGTVDPQ